MIIDKALIENGISEQLILRLINEHEKKKDAYSKLADYYVGQHDILKRHKENSAAPNNRVVSNFAKYITDMSVGYLLGNPVSYSSNVPIDTIIDCYYGQAMAQKDSELAKGVSIFGKCYELIYANSQSMPQSAVVQPFNAFIVYDDTVEHNKLFGVHYYQRFGIDGDTKDYAVTIHTDEEIMSYSTQHSGLSSLVLEDTAEHYFGDVPMIEYINNREEQGDYAQLIPLIDAYNILQSDRINDKEQFVDAFLLLHGIDVSSEQARKLKEEKILLAYDENGKAEYLSKVLNETDTEVLRKSINDDIHKFGLVPDMTDDKFGGNLSGVAIRYKLLAFEQMIKNKERYFEMGLKERMALYNSFFNVKKHMPIVDMSEVDCKFNRNLPVNEYELSQTLVNLKDRVSEETLLSQLPFVSDPKEEVDIVKKQREEENQSMMGLGGYDEQ